MNQTNLKVPPEPPITLLLIEPDVLARLVLADYLRGCGYVVLEVASSDEALEALRSTTEIELILAEINDIGSMNGFELAHSLRVSHPHIDVLLTTSQTHAAEKCHELCEHRVVKKPYAPQDIVRQINLLRQRRRTRKKPE
ncbi:MAG TPA: response regulator [Steroidobacteraceae bacterium]|jgi:CheY-like chemotaxis protein|nr:response regulator [Steroidobacteraceae bacterium]